jgi:hypothetical protein
MSLNPWDEIAIGTVAGVVVLFITLGKDKLVVEKDKRRIFQWLCKKTQQGKAWTVGSPINDPRWISTEEIACALNLPQDRVRYICSIHKKIRPKMKSDLFPNESLEEKWAVREFVKGTKP